MSETAILVIVILTLLLLIIFFIITLYYGYKISQQITDADEKINKINDIVDNIDVTVEPVLAYLCTLNSSLPFCPRKK